MTRVRDAYLSRIARKAWPDADVVVEDDDGAKDYVLLRPGRASLSLGSVFFDARKALREMVARADG